MIKLRLKTRYEVTNIKQKYRYLNNILDQQNQKSWQKKWVMKNNLHNIIVCCDNYAEHSFPVMNKIAGKERNTEKDGKYIQS